MILMYHNIDEEAGLNTLPVKDFEAHLTWLSANPDLKVVDFETYLHFLQFPTQEKVVTLTFDDAYTCLQSKVLPLIRKYKIPVLVFVPVNWVGKHNQWDDEAADPKKIDILSWSGLRELTKEKLVTFGSHGCSHISFGKLSLDEIRSELAVSKSRLEAELGREVAFFSYPFGQLKDLGPQSAQLLKDAGYRAGFTTNWSRKNQMKNQYALNRIEIQKFDNLARLKGILNRKIDWKAVKQQLKNVLYRLGISR